MPEPSVGRGTSWCWSAAGDLWKQGPPPLPWEPVQGACATRSFRGPGSQSYSTCDTVAVRITPGPALAACVAVTVAAQFTEDRERPGSRLPVSPSNPDLHLFLKTVFYTVCIYFFLFCLLFNPYLDSFETLQSDLTLELSVARAPHATGGCPKAPCAVLPGSPCTSVSPAAP